MKIVLKEILDQFDNKSNKIDDRGEPQEAL